MNNRPSFSIVLEGARGCNGQCAYCLAHSNGNKEKSHIKINAKKMIQTIKNTKAIYSEEKVQKYGIHFDLWNNGDGLMHLHEMQKIINILRKEWYNCSISISTNGILLADDRIAEWIMENNLTFQISHDGLGQWARTGDINPLEFENTIALAKLGFFTSINCTLTGYNHSFFKNIEYFNEWRKRNGLMNIKTLSIKLNHIYDSDYDDFEYKGKKYNSRLKGKVLDEYLSEFVSLAHICRKLGYTESYYYPYVSYIVEQSNRYNKSNNKSKYGGSCYNFQSGYQNWNFVISTNGKYCSCNLLDSSTILVAEHPKYCEKCRFKGQGECKRCASMPYAKKPEFCIKWLRVLENFYVLNQVENIVRDKESKSTKNKC